MTIPPKLSRHPFKELLPAWVLFGRERPVSNTSHERWVTDQVGSDVTLKFAHPLFYTGRPRRKVRDSRTEEVFIITPVQR